MNTGIILKELNFKAIRSSGAGGQHVNKVSSKIELSFDINNSEGLNQNEKKRILQKLASKISSSGKLILQCGDTRSQHRNKELVIQRFLELLKSNLHIPKPRKPSKPTKASVKKRLDNKKRISQKKANRKNPEF